MAKAIALAPDASRLASLLLSDIPAVCALVAPRQPGAGAAIIDRLSHSRPLRFVFAFRFAFGVRATGDFRRGFTEFAAGGVERLRDRILAPSGTE